MTSLAAPKVPLLDQAPMPRRVAMLSVHTSPLHQPGGGDAGGMNVYIVELARRLAALGIDIEIFTRATSSDVPMTVEMAPGVTVRHIIAGPYQGLRKEDLAAQLCAFAAGVMRSEAMREPGYYELVHSHYWLSGQVGWLAKERWGVPLIHSMHTLGKVKNASLAGDDVPEPTARLVGETQVVESADVLVANTTQEAEQLVSLYQAPPERVTVANPGVDLDRFSPGDRVAARRRLGLPANASMLLFVGRIQPLKAPDILLRAAAELIARDPTIRERLLVAVVGGPSGNGLAEPASLRQLARRLGIADVTRFVAPTPQDILADWYRAADVTVVPSYSESFGLVAIESQACGTPVVAARVGGLVTAVRHGESGFLVEGHRPADYATAIARLLGTDTGRRFGEAAVRHAAGFGWAVTAARVSEVYADVLATYRVADRLALSG
jgi:D-inositol-3-phosphate glycosyltransferase